MRQRAMRTAPGRTTRVTKTYLEKILESRRRSTEVFKDKLYDIERKATKEGNLDIAHTAQERRDRIMSSRQFVSPYADAFRRCASAGGGKSSSLEEEFTHAAKALLCWRWITCCLQTQWDHRLSQWCRVYGRDPALTICATTSLCNWT